MVGNYPLPPDIDLTEDAVFQGRDGFITSENHNLPWEEDKLANFTFRYVNSGWGNFEIASDDLWTSNGNFDTTLMARLINSTDTTTNGTNQRISFTSSNQLYYKTYSFNGSESTAYCIVDSYFEKMEDVFHRYYTEALGKEISPVYNEYLQGIDINELIVQKRSDNIEVDIAELKVDYEKIASEYFTNVTLLKRKLAYKLSYQEISIPFSPYEPDKDMPDDLTSFTGWDHGRYYKNVLPWEENDSGENIFRTEINGSINTTIVDTSIISESLESLVNRDDVEVFIA